MSKNDMVMVPRELPEQATCIDEFSRHEARKAIVEILNQPDKQHQSEPVVLLAHMDEMTADCTADSKAIGRNACLDEIAKLGPLYPHPAQGEPVAWLWTHENGLELPTTKENSPFYEGRGKFTKTPLYAHADPAEGKKWRLRAITSAQAANAQLDETNDLRAHLAEAHALLADCLGPVQDAKNNADCAANERLYHNLGNAIRAALSASAESSDKQQFREHLDKCAAEVATWPDWKREALGPSISTFENCRSKGPELSGLAIEGAAVEIDEQTAFMAWANKEYEVGADEELNLKNPSVRDNKIGWLARAALERKP